MTADVIVVEGRVEGDLKAQVSIAVRPKANVRGNLEAPVVNIAEGAKFNGSIKMEAGTTASSSTPSHDHELSVVRTGTAN